MLLLFLGWQSALAVGCSPGIFFKHYFTKKKREKGYHYSTSIYDGKVPPEILFQLLSLGFDLELFAAITKSWGLLFKHYWTLYVYKSIYKLVEYSMNYNEYSHKSSQKLKSYQYFLSLCVLNSLSSLTEIVSSWILRSTIP